MPILRPLITILSLSFLFLQTCDAVSILDLNNALKNSEVDVMVPRVCNNKLEDCLEEQEMESESNRRVLVMQRRYISYETLRRDMVPCAKPGASYYDCNAGQANPYNRGCEKEVYLEWRTEGMVLSSSHDFDKVLIQRLRDTSDEVTVMDRRAKYFKEMKRV
ncbi:Rapid ALkalinization Factor - like 5 [Theobroma cacao]|nr:Rapid ALkalinization Factor - like 5 [Theobroma cacao]